MTVKRLVVSKPNDDEIKKLASIDFQLDVLNVRIGPFVFFHPSLRWYLLGDETVVALTIRVSDDNPIDSDNYRNLQEATDRLILKYEALYFKLPKENDYEDFVDYFNVKYNDFYDITINLTDGRQLSFPHADHNLIDLKFAINTKMDRKDDDHRTIKLGGHSVQYYYANETHHLYSMSDVLDALVIKDPNDRLEYTRKFEKIEQPVNIKYKRFIGIESILRTMGWSTEQVNGYMIQKYKTPLSDDNIMERMLRSNQHLISKKIGDM